MMLTPAEMLAQAKRDAAERAALMIAPLPKPMNMQIQWALAIALNRVPATTHELSRYVYADIRL